MSEWWTYRPADFLMFSPRIYARLFEQLNAAWWPLHALLLPLALVAMVALARRRGRLATALGLALAWLFCAGVFVHALYRPINWAAGYLLPVLGGLAVLLPLLAWQVRRDAAAPPLAPRTALALAVWAVLLHPLLAPLAGQGWRQAEVLALAPDPTALATLAWLLTLPRPTANGADALWLRSVLEGLAWLLVLAWVGFSGFLLAAMGSVNAWVLLLACGLAALVRCLPVRGPRAER